jgi:hypothetical protein
MSAVPVPRKTIDTTVVVDVLEEKVKHNKKFAVRVEFLGI